MEQAPEEDNPLMGISLEEDSEPSLKKENNKPPSKIRVMRERSLDRTRPKENEKEPSKIRVMRERSLDRTRPKENEKEPSKIRVMRERSLDRTRPNKRRDRQSKRQQKGQDAVKDSYVTQEMLDRLVPNHRGLYTLRYRKIKESKNSVYEDIVEKFSTCGKVVNVDGDEGLIYVRFSERESALKALETFGNKLKLKVPCDTAKRRSENRQGMKIELDNMIEVYVDKIPANVTNDDLFELLEEFKPFVLKYVAARHGFNQYKEHGSAFVKFNGKDSSKAEGVIHKLNRMMFKGGKLYAGYPHETEAAKISETPPVDTIDVYMGNVPTSLSQEDIEERLKEFRPFELTVSGATAEDRSVFVKFQPDHRSKADSLVSEFNGTKWKDNQLVVELTYNTQNKLRMKGELNTGTKPKEEKQKSKTEPVKEVKLIPPKTEEESKPEEKKPVTRPWWKKPDSVLL